jgi:hypothetical protein
MTTTTTNGKPSRFDRNYDLIVTRRRRLLGMGGLDQVHVIGLWTDETGRRWRTELVTLGTAHSVDTALRLAEGGMQQHPAGTAMHRRYRDWHARLQKTERAMVRAEDAYWRKVREVAGDVPEYRSPAYQIAAE